MTKISASLIRDFLECDMKAYFRSTFTRTEEDDFTDAKLGILIHKAIQKNPKGSYKDLYGLVSSSIPDHTRILKKASRCINNYVNSFSNLVTNSSSLEYKFEYDIEGIRLIGVLDLLDLENKVIVDWKTSEKFPTNKELERDVQFNLYYETVRRMFNLDRLSVFYVSLTKNKMLEFVPNKVFINNLFSSLIPHVYKLSRNPDNFKIKKGIFTGACSNCQFHSICRGLDE